MLTLECQTVYDIISSIAGEEEVYKIIEAEEITSRLPSGVKLDKIRLAAIIRELKDRGYILVKYFTPDEYCLALVKRLENPKPQVTQEVENEVESTAVAVVKPATKTRTGASKVGAFFAALFGSILGSGIVAVVTILIYKFVL